MLCVWILQEQKVFEEGMNVQRLSKEARYMFWRTERSDRVDMQCQSWI